MKYLISFFVFTIWTFFMGSESINDYQLIQNKPIEVGTVVTFSIEAPEGSDPFIAWDFGDGTGLGRYKKGLSVTYRFTEPGVYQIFARIQGEEIPLTVTQTVHKPLTNPRPTHSSTIVMDDSLNLVWNVNPDNNSISCVNALNYELIHEISVGKHPRTLAIDVDSRVWVTNEDDASISIVNSSGSLVKTIELPYASKPYGICFDPQKQFAYVSLQATGELVKVNALTQKVVSKIDVGRSPRGIAINSTGNRLFVSQFISPENYGLVREINASTMTLTKEIELAYDLADDFEDKGRGVPNFLASITISPDESEIWVPSKKDNTTRGLFRDGEKLTFDNTVRTIVSKINLSNSTEDLSSRVDINDADQACAVEFSPYGNIVFVALQGNNRISMLNPDGNTRLGILDTDGLAPQGMVFNADGTKLFVQNFLSRNITVFDTRDIILAINFSPVIDTIISTIQTEFLDPQVLKGKQIFYNAQDDRMTFAGYISCATCHVDGGSDERVWDFTERGEGLRNTHSLLGRGGMAMGRVHWTSNFDEIQDFENDIRNGFGGKGFMSDELFNSGTTSDPLGDPKTGKSVELDALAAYLISLNKVNPSPFRNSDKTMTHDAVKGMSVFYEAGCNSCHLGEKFTDRPLGLLHDVGTITLASGERRGQELAGFGTPTLKGLWETAPYLHDGSAQTLMDVLVTRNSNNKHGDLSNYNQKDLDNLVAFLLQLDENEVNVPTGITKINSSDRIILDLFPNPSSDILKIKINEIGSGAKIRVYNLSTGNVVYKNEKVDQNNFDLDVRNLPSGYYVLEYTDQLSTKSKKFSVL